MFVQHFCSNSSDTETVNSQPTNKITAQKKQVKDFPCERTLYACYILYVVVGGCSLQYYELLLITLITQWLVTNFEFFNGLDARNLLQVYVETSLRGKSRSYANRRAFDIIQNACLQMYDFCSKASYKSNSYNSILTRLNGIHSKMEQWELQREIKKNLTSESKKKLSSESKKNLAEQPVPTVTQVKAKPQSSFQKIFLCLLHLHFFNSSLCL